MKRIFLGLAALPLMGMAQSGVMVTSLGGSAARSCYQSALARDATSQSMAMCDSAVAQGPLDERNLVASHVNRGILHLVRNNYRSAESDFSSALAIAPDQPEAWLNSGIADYQQGNMESASMKFERAIMLRTKSPALAYFGLGLAKEQRGDVRGAYADLRRAAELKPKWSEPARELQRFRVVRKGGAG